MKRKGNKRRYFVTTWCNENQAFTPQKGVRTGPYSLFGLRKAIRALRELGYAANYSRGYGDPSVAVDVMEQKKDGSWQWTW